MNWVTIKLSVNSMFLIQQGDMIHSRRFLAVRMENMWNKSKVVGTGSTEMCTSRLKPWDDRLLHLHKLISEIKILCACTCDVLF